jgi:hypothetical protein
MRWLLAVLLASGCYLSHRRADVGDDAGRAPDAGRSLDAGRPFDAGPLDCDDVIVRQLSIDPGDGVSSVTPRLVALARGDVGLVYVTSGAGDPTLVVYERIDRELERVTGPVDIATDSFTWAEPAWIDGAIVVAYGLAGDRASVLRTITIDGTSLRTTRVPLYHPSILQATDTGLLFWLAFAMRADNSLEIAHVGVDGALAHDMVSIPLGRYGSGHAALAHPDRPARILGYPSEGPPGVRAGRVITISESGELDHEQTLMESDDHSVTPVLVDGRLVFVRNSDDALTLELANLDTLERIEAIAYPPVPRGPLASVLADRLLVAHVEGTALVLDLFDRDLRGPATVTETLPAGIGASSGSIVSFGDAIVLALNLSSGGETFPHIVRIDCAP